MLKIEPLGRQHDRAGFDCGSSELNNYLRSTARQHLERGLSRTFVLIDEKAPTSIVGFFTLTSCEIRVETLPVKYAKKYPHRAPAAKLARLAVQVEKQRQGLGSLMMVDAMQRIIAVAEHLGVIGFFVDAKNDKAQVFYKQFGFLELPDNPLELFLPIATLRQAL